MATADPLRGSGGMPGVLITVHDPDLQAELGELDDDPASDPAGTARAVAVWEDAVARNDIPTQRAMIKRAFPKLTLAPPRHFNDQGPERFLWDGPTA